jgi:hypothetical protein
MRTDDMVNPPRDPVTHVADGFRALVGRSDVDQRLEAGLRTLGMTPEELGLIGSACEAYADAARRRLAELQRGRVGGDTEPAPKRLRGLEGPWES